ncbi:putative tip elongation protein 1 [Erysiphe neolycopersici]|uniref:Putative tip elongation protein 1 n=1 Tax=Erysiphe neolycopersici TaxID=212602 RepID=A0A420I783_9PEZI|nr:putative tip elongation protein 1 [Erysiphe neolycopersici]
MPSSQVHEGDLRIGDRVEVPGKMHGTVKFIGTVDNKKGMFVGVELSEEFASRGKNSGDVDGLSYFVTTIPGAGIFLPVNRATRRKSSTILNEGSLPLIPETPTNGGIKNPRQGPNNNTTPSTGISRFNQSFGAGRAPSPQCRNVKRPSLPRPESPLRKQQYSLKPPNVSPSGKTPTKYSNLNIRKFGQSVRGTQDSRDSKKIAGTPRSLTKSSLGSRSTSALGHSSYAQLEPRATPIGSPTTKINTTQTNLESLHRKNSSNNDEISRLKALLAERDRQLKEQAISLAEMENALTEVQNLIDSDTNSRTNRNGIDDRDIVQLRAMLREKNEKISMLTTEFDAHRADFRSTIDTLEMASSETERVYEQRISEMMQEINDLSSQSVDVNNVAKHLKQLEELVQELEEGLEEARRAEVEARGEVEFLRGEVERTRAELKRERENINRNSIEAGSNTNGVAVSKELKQRDDEIRGLKKIIHSLSRDSVQDLVEDLSRPSTKLRSSFVEGLKSIETRRHSNNLKRESSEISQIADAKTNTVGELQWEGDDFHQEISGALNASASVTQRTSVVSNSQGKVVNLTDHGSRTAPDYKARALMTETYVESDAYSSANESFCELCETPGHDILICSKVFTLGSNRLPSSVKNDNDFLAPYSDNKPSLSPKKVSRPISEQVIINSIETEPIAGKESGVIDMDKWCAVCERDGHESIDCPFEDTYE